MKVMILAAGRGERMRPLTDSVPKPLIKAGTKRLIEFHLYNLARAGFKDVVINVAWLGQKIIDTIGNGEKYNLNIEYSNEGGQALETGGGIVNALPLLGDDAFLVVNGDVWTDYPFEKLINFSLKDKAHLVLVNNPEHNPEGDFAILNNRLIEKQSDNFTFSGIGVYSADFFKGQVNDKFPLAPMIRKYISENKISGELYNGKWMDIGTQQRLQDLIQSLD
ncbi:MAG: mannose-1-phosphate guanylyltransferase [endosymbiont of Galathealinum brachiosum]|uniref:Mannose-1-phosphate guanylyltransferase n=1 Tax=endosymbiont of Galathealinum brachiosum TaxID=2200906 RepID=A0A370DB02_9GAMM|nr:MAG: mannose-1-phosphate guanylyltransferase [endosymbiont of Galathealinum brachiosum]